MTADITAQRTYTTAEAATIMRVDPSTLRRWRTARPPQGPAFVRVSARHVIYGHADLQDWLRSRRIVPGIAV
jgi:hypothetical protein